MRLISVLLLSLFVFLESFKISHQAIHPYPSTIIDRNIRRRRFFKCFSWLRIFYICGSNQDAPIHPGDTGDFVVQNNQIPLSLDPFTQALQIDPFDAVNLTNVFNICELGEGRSGFRSNNFFQCEDVLLNIVGYLTLPETFEFRLINRRTFTTLIFASRRQLFSELRPEITCGFECLHNFSLSAAFFARLSKPINSVLRVYRKNPIKVETVFALGEYIDSRYSNINFENAFKTVNNFENLVYTTLAFFRRYNNDSFLELFEVACRAKFFKDTEFLSDFYINTETLTRYALETDKVTTLKFLMKNSAQVPGLNELFSVVNVAISYRSTKIFKYLIKRISENNNINYRDRDLLNIIRAVFMEIMNADLLDYSEWMYGHLRMNAVVDFSIIHAAINNRNIRFARLILSNRLGLNYDFLFSNKLALIDYVISKKFPEFIDLIYSLFVSRYDFFRSIDAISIAIEKKSHECLRKILQLTTNSGALHLDQIYCTHDLSEIISSALARQDSSSLILILNTIQSSVGIEELFITLPESHPDFKFYNRSSLYRYVIDKNAMEAFEILVEQFGSESLKSFDRVGRTPYFHAIARGAENFVVRILLECPESATISDVSGNTAMHIALFLKAPFEIFKLLEHFELLNWTVENRIGLSPLDIFQDMCKSQNDGHQEKYLGQLKGLIPSELLINT